jgi:DNA-binding MarR family transcriptional regulator
LNIPLHYNKKLKVKKKNPIAKYIPRTADYLLENQISFILRKVNQRHAGIFAETITNELTPTKFSALSKIYELGSLSQNELGRMTAMDVATIKGLIDRSKRLNLVRTRTDPIDARRHLIELTPLETVLIERAIPKALTIGEKTLRPLSNEEQITLLKLLTKISFSN